MPECGWCLDGDWAAVSVWQAGCHWEGYHADELVSAKPDGGTTRIKTTRIAGTQAASPTACSHCQCLITSLFTFLIFVMLTDLETTLRPPLQYLVVLAASGVIRYADDTDGTHCACCGKHARSLAC